MKALVSCDEYCRVYKGKYYLRDVGMTFVNRYLMSFDSVRLVIRTKIVSDLSELGKFSIPIEDNRVEIWPVPMFQGPIQYLRYYFSIRRSIVGVCEGCDIAILRLPSTIAFDVLGEIRKNKLPYATELVFDCHDAIVSSENIINKIIWTRLHEKQVKACEYAIGIAPVTEFYLQKHYKSDVPDAVNTHYSSIELTEDFFFEPRQYPKGKDFVVVHVANQVAYNRRKGHNDLIHVVKRLSEEGINVKIVFVGEDYNNGIQLLKNLAEQLGVKDKVTFTGFLKYNDMREVLKKSDLAVLPTKAEGLPRVVIEAMAMGLPCLTTRVSGNPELIEDKFLFDYGDIEAMVVAISQLYNDENLYCATSKRNYEKSREYRKNILDERRKTFYDTLINKVKGTKS